MIVIIAQNVLFNKVVFASTRAAPVGRRPDQAVHAHAMLNIGVLSEVRRCCSGFDKTQYFAEILEDMLG